MRLIPFIVIFLVGCGGGGSSDSTVTPSWVQAVIVDDGFTQEADVSYVLYADPMVAGTYTGEHGDASILEFKKKSNASVIGYVPWDETVVVPDWPLACFIPSMPNCSDAKVDLDKPVYWAADNGIQVVYIRWGGCCFDSFHEAAAKYAWDRGTVVIWAASQGSVELPYASPYMFVVSSFHDTANYGAAVDYTVQRQGTSHPAVAAAALIAEIYKKFNPTPDAEGSQFVINTFLQGRR